MHSTSQVTKFCLLIERWLCSIIPLALYVLRQKLILVIDYSPDVPREPKEDGKYTTFLFVLSLL